MCCYIIFYVIESIARVGYKAPDFKAKAYFEGKFFDVSLDDYKGSYVVLFFYPSDFTFVCPTEIAEFNKELRAFKDRDAVVLGGSTDSQFVHLAWRQNHADLRNLGYPMLADNKKELTEALGILHRDDKVPLRATYIVDPDGIIRWVSVNDLKVGRNVHEVIRTLDALQTDELCPCNWGQGQQTLTA